MRSALHDSEGAAADGSRVRLWPDPEVKRHGTFDGRAGFNIVFPALIGLIVTVCGRSHGGVVEDWNEEMIQTFRTEVTSPCLGSRHLAILHAAMHDAINACMPHYPTYRPVERAIKLSPEEAVRLKDPALASLAGAAAAHEVLQSLAPGRKAAFDRRLAGHLGSPTAEANQRDALKLGRAIAAQMCAERADDGSATAVPYVPSPKLGHWRRTSPTFRPPESPHWSWVRPFALDTASQFRAPPVPAPGSPEFAAMLNEVRILGAKDSATRTEEQTLIARFWSDFSYTSTPPGHWNEIARDISMNEPLDLYDSARLFFLLNLALADAGVAVWDSKYHYNTWRPITAIQHQGHQAWQPLLNTPPHPEYVSGHSGFSGAAAGVLEALLPNRPAGWTFTVRSDTITNVTRPFSSFRDCATECSRSRIYGGIHFRHACEEGLVLGYRVAEEVLRKFGGNLAASSGSATNRLLKIRAFIRAFSSNGSISEE